MTLKHYNDMKKLSLYLTLAVTGLFSTACTGDYTDWAEPQSNPQEEAITIPGVAASAATTEAIDLATAESAAVKVLSLSAAALPTGTSIDKIRIIVTPEGTEGDPVTVWGSDANGNFSVEDLQEVVTKYYGYRPTPRTLNCHAYLAVMLDGQATYVDAGTFQVNITPKAPIIEDAYYYVGAANGWSDSDQTYKLVNGGGDVYDDPVFTVVIPAPKDGDGNRIENWFKIAPASAYTREEGFWGGDMIGAATNGESAMEGRFVIGKNDEVAMAFCIGTPDDEALFYRLEFNMLDQTYKVTPVGFNEFIYEIGNESGWSEPHPLHGNGQGQYNAVIYLNGEFKFKPNKDNWDGDWEKASGDDTAGTLTADGGPNMDGVAAGFYFIQVDLKAMTYKLTPVTSISIIGSVRGMWDTDVDMTYNENLKCWEARETLNAGEFKFRANHDWAINWGGTFEDLTQGGDNLKLEADGAYIIRLYLSDEAPAHCTVKLDSGYPDFIFEIGNESSWSTSHPLLGNGAGQYSGIYYLNGEFKFKPNADNWDGDYEKVSGDAYAGTLTTDGGPNVDAPEAGVYVIDVDLDAMTYKLTALTAVGIIGNGGDWNNDIDMTYNVDAGCFEVTTELAASEFKFRANHDWAINWGGSFDNLTQDGANLSVAEAGTYKVQLFLSYAGKHYCTITKQ